MIDTRMRITVIAVAMATGCTQSGASLSDYGLLSDHGGTVGEARVDAGAETDAESSRLPLAVAVGEYGAILEFDGESWTRAASPLQPTIDNELDGVAFSAGRVFAVGARGALLERQGGVWRQVSVPTSGGLMSVAVTADGKFGVAVGQGGVILHYDGEQWSKVTSPLEKPGDIWLFKVALYSKDFGVAVGGNRSGALTGVVLVYRDGVWSAERQNQDRDLSAVGIASPSHVAVGGYSEHFAKEPTKLMEWKGPAWTAVSVSQWRRNVTHIDLVHPNFGLAVTDGGGTQQSATGALLLKYTQSTGWTELGDTQALIGEAKAATSACVLNDQQAFVVGTGPTIMALEQGTWRLVDTKAFADVVTLHGVACRP